MQTGSFGFYKMSFTINKKKRFTDERAATYASEQCMHSRQCTQRSMQCTQHARQNAQHSTQYAEHSLLLSAKRQCRYLALVMPALLTVLISGCGSIDLKRMTYDMLRQHDCLVNEFDEVCTRSYALDYYDYKQVRNSYLQSMTATRNVTATDAIAVTSEAVSLQLSEALSGTSSTATVLNAQRISRGLSNLQASLSSAASL